MLKSISTRALAIAALAIAALGGAAVAQPVTRLTVGPAPDEPTPATTIGYVAPDTSGVLGRRYIQPTPRANALSLVSRNAAALGANVTTVSDEGGDALIVVYLGDPRDFVDCGEIVATGRNGEERRLDAATNALTLKIERPAAEDVVETKRWMLIAARTTIRMERRAGPPFFAIARSSYVLTKIVSSRVDQGVFIGRTVDTIAFESGATDAFDKGTRCMPTGELEQRLLANL